MSERDDRERELPVVAGFGFDDLQRWASSGGAQVGRDAQLALRLFLRSHRVRAHVAALAATRRIIEVMTRARSAADDLEKRLFDDRRLAHMKTTDLIALYGTVATREHRATEAAIRAAQGARMPLVPEDDIAALQQFEGAPPELDPSDPNLVKVLQAIGAAMGYQKTRVLQRVTRPPTVQ